MWRRDWLKRNQQSTGSKKYFCPGDWNSEFGIWNSEIGSDDVFGTWNSEFGIGFKIRELEFGDDVVGLRGIRKKKSNNKRRLAMGRNTLLGFRRERNNSEKRIPIEMASRNRKSGKRRFSIEMVSRDSLAEKNKKKKTFRRIKWKGVGNQQSTMTCNGDRDVARILAEMGEETSRYQIFKETSQYQSWIRKKKLRYNQ